MSSGNLRSIERGKIKDAREDMCEKEVAVVR